MLKTKNADSVPPSLGLSRVQISELSTLFLKTCLHNFLFRCKKGAKWVLVLPVLGSVQSFLPQQQLTVRVFLRKVLELIFHILLSLYGSFVRAVSKPNIKWPKNNQIK